MASDSPNYVKAAFANVYNLTLLGGAAMASLFTGDWLIGVGAVGLEALWLVFGPDFKPFQRAVRESERQERDKADRERVAKLMSELSEREWQRAKALGKIAQATASRWVNLTGTPAPYGLKDLWGQIWFLDAGHRLGRTYDAFSQRWFKPTRDGFGIEPMPHALEEISKALSDICVTITDGLQVDEPILNEIYVELPVSARRLYQDMEKRMFKASRYARSCAVSRKARST